MTDRDAYRDDMSFLRPLDIDDPDLAPLVEEARALFRQPPAPAVASRHVTSMVEHAKAALADLPVERRPVGRSIRLVARLGIVAAAFGLLTGGLALAGVDLPGLPDRASDHAKEAVDEGEAQGDEDMTEEVSVPTLDQLPENAGDTARNVIGTIETNLPLLHEGQISGCEFGAMVSAAARDVEPDTSKCDQESNEDGGSEASAKGRARAEEAKAAGRAVGEEASGGKANAGGKSDAGSENSAGGKEKSEEAKAAGRAVGEEASGGKANPGGNSPTD